jgi:mono/diheme cytochrome c family protein
MNRLFMSIVLVFFSLAAYMQAPQQSSQMEQGKKVYVKNCLACHMADGGGVPGLNPPLGKTEWVTGDKKRLINVLLKGLNDPIVVNGEEYANPMPAVEYLTDQEIADVLTYIRGSFGNKASAVSPAEVKALRPKN